MNWKSLCLISFIVKKVPPSACDLRVTMKTREYCALLPSPSLFNIWTTLAWGGVAVAETEEFVRWNLEYSRVSLVNFHVAHIIQQHPWATFHVFRYVKDSILDFTLFNRLHASWFGEVASKLLYNGVMCNFVRSITSTFNTELIVRD